MSFTINRNFSGADNDDICPHKRKAFAEHSFSLLPEINIKATIKMSLDVEMPAYRILGVCHPKITRQALGIDSPVGAMLPCDVILREVEGGVEVSAIDPVAPVQAIENDEMNDVAGRVRDLLAKAIESI